MADTATVSCAPCNVPLQQAEDDTFLCPSCGTRETRDAIIREVGEYTTEKMADHLSESLRDAVRGSKMVTFKEGDRVRKTHRFKVDLRL